MILDALFVIKGIFIGISVSAPLGPIAVLAIQRTLNKGFKSGLVSGTGAASADIIYAIIVGFSITFISDFLTRYQEYFRIIGGMFLIFIGLRIFSSNPGKQIRRLKLKGNNYYKDFITSFFLTISNPLTILAFGAFFTGLGMVDKTGGSFPVVVMIVSVFSGALAWWIGLISIITIFKRRIRLRSLLWINRITGTFIVLFALYLILTVFIPEISAL